MIGFYFLLGYSILWQIAQRLDKTPTTLDNVVCVILCSGAWICYTISRASEDIRSKK